jgi:hypothetical protein
MNKRVILICICILALATGLAWAGEAAKGGSAGSPKGKAHGAAAGAEHGMDMAAMKAEMMKCAVCKNMAPQVETFMPIMTMDSAKLNDGVMMMHGVSDPSKAAEFHALCSQMAKAGEATMTMTDEQAKTELCPFCQGIRSAMKSGAKMSKGETKLGDVMVMTSADPAVQTQLFALADQCAMMSEMMSTHKDMAKK